MKYWNDLSDCRFKVICMHCGGSLDDDSTNKEHIPTRSLLDKPYPQQLPTMVVHSDCNVNYSQDEEYFATFLASVLAGSADPEQVRIPSAAKSLQRSSKLQQRIERSRTVQGTLWGAPEIQWFPELDRVKRVIVKNARGHAFYELGEPRVTDPSSVTIVPLDRLSSDQRKEFEIGSDDIQLAPWPEVGSRLMQRLVSGDIQSGGWIEVQPKVYRYAVSQEFGGVLVKLILREYLAAEIFWNDSDEV